VVRRKIKSSGIKAGLQKYNPHPSAQATIGIYFRITFRIVRKCHIAISLIPQSENILPIISDEIHLLR
jgi:hypothetical protein